MIAGLEDITAGDIYIGDQRVNDLHPKNRNIGLAFEDYALYPPLTVYDNIAFNLKAKGVSQDEIKQRVMDIAPLLKVEDLLTRCPFRFQAGRSSA